MSVGHSAYSSAFSRIAATVPAMENSQLGAAQTQSPSGMFVLPSPFYPNPGPQRPPRIPHYHFHLVVSSLQLTFGTLCFAFAILGHSIDWDNVDSGCGYYGVPFFLAGLFGFLATRPNSVINKKCNFFSCCLTFSVISSIASIIGISISKVEQTRIRRLQSLDLQDVHLFHLIKLLVVLAICAVEFLVSIVHAGFVCASCCDQCVKREVPTVPPPAPILPLPEITQQQSASVSAGTSSAVSAALPLIMPPQPTALSLPKLLEPILRNNHTRAPPPTYEETFPYEGPPLEDFDESPPRRLSP